MHSSGAMEINNSSTITDYPAPTTPVTFRLPSKNGRDPWFHLSRSWYFAAEARGDLKMIRLRAKGKTRGVTLVPFEAVRALIMKAE